MIKSRPCFSGWKIRHHKMRTAASNLCCSLPCHHLLFSTSHISLIILFRLKPPSFYSIVKTSQEIRLLRHPQEAAVVQCNSPAQATSANLSLLVVTFHSIQTRCQGPPSSQTTAQQNHVEVKAPVHWLSCTWITDICALGKKKGHLLGPHIRLQTLSTLSVVTLKFKNLSI